MRREFHLGGTAPGEQHAHGDLGGQFFGSRILVLGDYARCDQRAERPRILDGEGHLLHPSFVQIDAYNPQNARIKAELPRFVDCHAIGFDSSGLIGIYSPS